ncbi:hypothetical protein P5673_005432 [Acropora cervicornis]|uniref:Granulins domain-containing protein n=1 Tax=Acropora cervicornis TaxID=6130 RepID=A0AAD9QYT6_ACRCE|nr:hypothetical protein P5673_005432 [Acropora cervicornis]
MSYHVQNKEKSPVKITKWMSSLTKYVLKHFLANVTHKIKKENTLWYSSDSDVEFSDQNGFRVSEKNKRWKMAACTVIDGTHSSRVLIMLCLVDACVQCPDGTRCLAFETCCLVSRWLHRFGCCPYGYGMCCPVSELPDMCCPTNSRCVDDDTMCLAQDGLKTPAIKSFSSSRKFLSLIRAGRPKTSMKNRVRIIEEDQVEKN